MLTEGSNHGCRLMVETENEKEREGAWPKIARSRERELAGESEREIKRWRDGQLRGCVMQRRPWKQQRQRAEAAMANVASVNAPNSKEGGRRWSR